LTTEFEKDQEARKAEIKLRLQKLYEKKERDNLDRESSKIKDNCDADLASYEREKED
jgi:hypothetical protein